MSALYNDYISKIESAETEEQVDFFVAEYGKETEKIFTAAEKSELRAKYVKQIEDCYSSLDLKEYGEEEKADLRRSWRRERRRSLRQRRKTL